MNHDAVAMVAARSHYTARARELEKLALTAASIREAREIAYKAKIAQRAAMAELVNPEVPRA
jgi:hypothetical protein